MVRHCRLLTIGSVVLLGLGATAMSVPTAPAHPDATISLLSPRGVPVTPSSDVIAGGCSPCACCRALDVPRSTHR